MAFDPMSNTTLLFGGATPTQPQGINDTWEWNGSTWSVDHPTNTPNLPDPYYFAPALTYDPINHGMLLFDGSTWEWNGSDWTELQPAHVPDAYNHWTMATDTANNTVVLLEYDPNAGAGASEETWEWSGSDWLQQSPVIEPPCCGVMGYDPGHNMMLYQVQDQTWKWDGAYWLQLNPADEINAIDITTGPEGSGLLAITGNSVGSPLSTYQWTGTDWSQIQTGTAPPETGVPSLADGPTGAVLFGGGTTTGSDVSNATWVFAADQTTPPANTPEVPYALALPVIAFGLIGGAVWFRRRRSVPPVGGMT
jgi:hypothetical protein